MEAGIDTRAALCLAMQTLCTNEFTIKLKTTTVPLSSLIDSRGFNIFHDIAECFVKESYLLEYLEILCSEFQDRYFDESKELISKMLNSSAGDDKMTPTMLAVRHNRSRLLKEFIRLGADFCKKESNGRNIVHIAAASGFELILVYLCFDIKMSYVEPDRGGRTPLHLACLEGQVGTGMLLIIWNEEIDVLDKEGFAPIHLATLAQSYKIVRNLLIMGVDPKSTTSDNVTALDIALQRQDKSIVKLLKPTPCCCYFNPFHKKIKPVKSSYMRLVLFLLLSIFRIGVISTTILPNMNILAGIPSVCLFFLSLFFFFISCCKSPGYTQNPQNLSLTSLYESYRPEYVCPYCEKRKPKHARHCHYCKRCIKVIKIQQFDHHCPWINNCVGKKNYRFFMCFLTFSIFDYSLQSSLAVMNYLGIFTEKEHFFYEIKRELIVTALGIAGLSLAFLVFFMPVWLTQIMNWSCSGSKKGKKKVLVRHSSSSFVEVSDTASMMKTADHDFNSSGFNQASFLMKDVKSDDETGCCLSSSKL